MIVRDNERSIEPCLQSIVPWVNQIVIVDTGSRDSTKDVIARVAPSAEIYDFNPQTHPDAFILDVYESWGEQSLEPFSGLPILADFARARQYGWDKAKSDYLMWIDSDDVLVGGDKLQEVVGDMRATNTPIAMVNYDYFSDSQGRSTGKLQRERIIRRGVAKWSQPIHEVLAPNNHNKFYDQINVVHKRHEYAPSPIKRRNLKVLLKHHEASLKVGNVDPRIIYYLATEERFLWPDKAVQHFSEYIKVSGWDEERAQALLAMAGIYEAKSDLEAAFFAYSRAHLEFPSNVDALFGCARLAYYRAKNDQIFTYWHKCIEYTEKAFSILKSPRRVETQFFDPAKRECEPYIYYSYALIEVRRFKDAVEAAKKGLAWNPEGEWFEWLTTNLSYAQSQLDGTGKSFALLLPENDLPESPPPELPEKPVAGILSQLWKYSYKESPAKALSFLESLPEPYASHERIVKARNYVKNNLPRRKLDILIWTGPAWETWTPKSLDTGIGGSETAAINMARCLADRGHRVTVINDCGNQSGFYGSVEYIDYRKVKNSPSKFSSDLLIVSRQAEALLLPIPAKHRVLWVHDIHCGAATPEVLKALDAADTIFCLSKWHKEFFCAHYTQLDPNKVVVTRNGIDPKRFATEPVKEGNRLIYASSPDRGLDRLLRFFPAIRNRVPDAELHVYYGFANWEKHASPAQRQQIDALKRQMNTTAGVFFHDRVGQRELAEAYLRSKVAAYCTSFTETSCISMMEAQAAGCVPVTTALAALNETVRHGILIQPPEQSPLYADAFVSEVSNLLMDEKKRSAVAALARKDALENLPWEKVAVDWERLLPDLTSRPARVPPRRLRIAAKYGYFSSHIHGPFDIEGLFTRRALTGSESCFFHSVKALALMGHQVDVFCDVPAVVQSDYLGGSHVYPISQQVGHDYDLYLSWNEPELLKHAPANKLRVCFQQLNDFSSYCNKGFDAYVDHYVSPSEAHRRYITSIEPVTPEKFIVLPNPISLDMFSDLPARSAEKCIIWTSSPDRGLHNLLDIYPHVRKAVPDVTLKIFYRFQPWYDGVKNSDTPSGVRARKIHEQLATLGRNGENGVYLMDARPNVEVHRALAQARVFAYPCEPISFTEGFSVSVMDACAAGCPAVISDADALEEIYGQAAHIVKGPAHANIHAWTEALVRVLRDDAYADELSARGKNHARRFDRALTMKTFEDFVMAHLK